MRLTQQQRETVISFITVLVTVFLFVSTFFINMDVKFLSSARLMPLLVTSLMLLLSLIYFVRSVSKSGFVSPKTAFGALKESVKDPTVNSTLKATGIVALYIFVGIRYIGFYISSFLLIAFIALYFVRRIKPLYSILISLALSGLLYLIFRVAFKIYLR